MEGKTYKGDLKIKLIHCEMFNPTIDEPKDDIGHQVDMFHARWLRLLNRYAPDYFIAERFQPRGFGGNTIEVVNMMLGIMMCSTYQDRKLVTASTWKNAANRVFDLKELYVWAKKEHKLEAHPLDSTLIGIYRLNQLLSTTMFQLDPYLLAKQVACVLKNKM